MAKRDELYGMQFLKKGMCFTPEQDKQLTIRNLQVERMHGVVLAEGLFKVDEFNSGHFERLAQGLSAPDRRGSSPRCAVAGRRR